MHARHLLQVIVAALTPDDAQQLNLISLIAELLDIDHKPIERAAVRRRTSQAESITSPVPPQLAKCPPLLTTAHPQVTPSHCAGRRRGSRRTRTVRVVPSLVPPKSRVSSMFSRSDVCGNSYL